MRSLIASSGLFFLSVAAQASHTIDNPLPVITPQFNSPSTVWNDLSDALPVVPSTIEPFESGYSFASCGAGTGDGVEEYDAYNIFYDDCPEPWQVCLHKDNGISLDSVAEMFGKVPVGFRQYVRDLTVGNNSVAFWKNTSLVMSPNFWRIYVMIHESTHAVDLLSTADLIALDAGTYSDSQEWRDAYYSDKSVPTTGSNYLWEESFAEMGPRAFYDWYVEGGLANFQPNWSEFENQLSTFKSLVGHRAQLGGTCEFRVANEPAVPTSSTSRRRRGPAPDTSFKSDIRVIRVPDNLPTFEFTE
ncbi:unnamed protein product [Clonostachys byssicola]|uniref:Conidiation-specific protein 13 n=1 Tax=Clonostachys byssicola TaxID=160290 RepID=A0A9N9UC50_9HYPO|nr:unnamed protein product [Clonostachys byssicola]